MNLYSASRQWKSRPNDERFRTIEELIAFSKAVAQASSQISVSMKDLQVSATESGEVELVGKQGVAAGFTHFGFGQFCGLVGAPSQWCRETPADLAVDNINYAIKRNGYGEDDTYKLLLMKDEKLTGGKLKLRAINGEGYGRIWNYEVAEKIAPALQNGWSTPKAMDEEERPSALYASDRDVFIFLVNHNIQIDDGSGDRLFRGLFVEQSEVGTASLSLTEFYCKWVCGNHIVWGAKNVQEIAIRHVGDVEEKFKLNFEATVKRIENESVSDIERTIKRLRVKRIAATKEELLDMVFGRRILTKKDTLAAYALAEKFAQVDGHNDPLSAWGFAQGVTRLSQEQPYGDKRTELDRAAGKVLNLADRF